VALHFLLYTIGLLLCNISVVYDEDGLESTKASEVENVFRVN